MKSNLLFISIVILTCCYIYCTAQTKVPEAAWGGSIGGIDMHLYTPNGLSGNAPIVVAIHGCGETPSIYANGSDWNKLADMYGFYVIYPFSSYLGQEQVGNCFNWWEESFGCSSARDQEAADIILMVDYLKSLQGITNCNTYVSGFSAGAGMTAVLCAKYPSYFSGGAPIAGVPHGVPCLFSVTAMSGLYDQSPTTWGNLVFNENPNYVGDYPKMIIMHGFVDGTVNYNNFDEMIEQWTTVHGIDQFSDQTVYPYNYNTTVTQGNHIDSNGDIKVQTFTVSNLGHAITVDAFDGIAGPQGGNVSTFSYHVDGLWSSFQIAKFWGIIDGNTNCSNFCLSNLNLSNSYSIDSIGFKVSNGIQSTEHIFGTSSVTYDATNYVELHSNFCVEIGAEFEVIIQGCY